MTDLILVFDQGTTGSATAFFDAETLELLSYHKVEFEQIFPQSGWVEHNATHIWEACLKAYSLSLSQLGGNARTNSICAIGITNQRETTVAWNRKSGELAGNAIVWQDRRTTERCKHIRADTNLATSISQKTGLVIDPYFSSTKMEWMLKHYPKAQAWAKSGELALGTIDSYLIYRLTGGASFLTEPTNASRTMLFDLRRYQYEEELLNIFGIPQSALPKIQPSASLFGKTRGVKDIPDGIPICGVVGDQQSALLGHDCFAPGQAKITFGTGAFLLMHTGETVHHSSTGILSTAAFTNSNTPAYALEGSAFIAGAALQYLRDQFGWFDNAALSESLALSDPRDPQVLFVPSLSGLGAPYWNADARGVLMGLSRGTSRSQITRAVIESIALQNVELLSLMQQQSHEKIPCVAVDGGATASKFLVQFQADVLQIPVVRPHNVQVTARGAAQAARLGLNPGTKPIRNNRVDTITPNMTSADALTIVGEWERAVKWVNEFYGGQ